MMRQAIATLAALAITLAMFIGGCESFGSSPADKPFETDCQKSTKISYPDGKRHGEECTKADDCQYGYCKLGALQLINDHTKGVCTKDCSCGAGSQCDADNISGQGYTCLIGAAKPVQKECGATCSSDADCQALNPALPFCLTNANGYSGVFSTARKVCAAKKP